MVDLLDDSFDENLSSGSDGKEVKSAAPSGSAQQAQSLAAEICKLHSKQDPQVFVFSFKLQKLLLECADIEEADAVATGAYSRELLKSLIEIGKTTDPLAFLAMRIISTLSQHHLFLKHAEGLDLPGALLEVLGEVKSKSELYEALCVLRCLTESSPRYRLALVAAAKTLGVVLVKNYTLALTQDCPGAAALVLHCIENLTCADAFCDELRAARFCERVRGVCQAYRVPSDDQKRIVRIVKYARLQGDAARQMMAVLPRSGYRYGKLARPVSRATKRVTFSRGTKRGDGDGDQGDAKGGREGKGEGGGIKVAKGKPVSQAKPRPKQRTGVAVPNTAFWGNL